MVVEWYGTLTKFWTLHCRVVVKYIQIKYIQIVTGKLFCSIPPRRCPFALFLTFPPSRPPGLRPFPAPPPTHIPSLRPSLCANYLEAEEGRQHRGHPRRPRRKQHQPSNELVRDNDLYFSRSRSRSLSPSLSPSLSVSLSPSLSPLSLSFSSPHSASLSFHFCTGRSNTHSASIHRLASYPL